MSIIGELIYKLYYQPKNKKAYINKFGGLKNYLEMLAAEKEMREYALNELVIDANLNPSGKYKISFLTGEKFIHQSLFCTYSFLKFLNKKEISDFSVNYYSDGTLGPDLIELLKTRFPGITVFTGDNIAASLAEKLPQSIFPNLNKNVGRFPLFKKLIYPNLNGDGLLIFFDSDMLFLKRPTAFLDWLLSTESAQDNAFGIQDVQRSYGYSDAEISLVWPDAVVNDINSGMYAIQSKNVDWSFLENLSKQFEDRYGPHYYMEQLMTAILLEKTKHLTVAPKSEYIVFPSKDEVTDQLGTLHHYVNESKEHYFKYGWRRQIV